MNNSKNSVRTLTMLALLVAMSIVFSRVLSISTGFVRFNLGSLPVLLAALPLPPTAVSAALEVSAGCADFAARGGAAALYGCCACLSVLGVSVWAQLRLFAGAAYRPRLLVFSRAVHLVLLQLLVRVCAQLLPGKKSVAFSLTFRNPDRTLSDDDVNPLMQKILAVCEAECGASLRL